MRQNVKRRKINVTALTKVRKAAKTVRNAAAAGNVDEANQALKQAFAALDKAAKKNVIHKNNASRHKSRLSKFVSKSTKK